MLISMITPMRKPSRIPFFTQAFTRHPVGADASGSAARASPEFSAARKRANRRRPSSEYASGARSNRVSICWASWEASSAGMHAPVGKHSTGAQHIFDLLLIGGAGRDQRQPPDRLQQP